MAFRFEHSDDYGDMAEINVTPLVDVMLVLLIIFMITAPMLTQGLTVALPTAEGKSFELASNNPAKIQVTASGAVYLDGVAAGSTSLETPVQLALSCSDPDSGDALTYSAVSVPSHGTLGAIALSVLIAPIAYVRWRRAQPKTKAQQAPLQVETSKASGSSRSRAPGWTRLVFRGPQFIK